jgi:hypothetical protein
MLRTTIRVVCGLSLVASLAGCVRYSSVPHGRLLHESAYANDSLRVSVADFGKMRFTLGSLTAADKQLLKRLPYNERVVRVLFTSCLAGAGLYVARLRPGRVPSGPEPRTDVGPRREGSPAAGLFATGSVRDSSHG